MMGALQVFYTQMDGHTSFKMLYECVPMAIVIPYIFTVSLKFGAQYITVQQSEFRIKNVTLYLHIFLSIFCCYCFHFIFIFNEASNFHNKILANQKQELVIRTNNFNQVLTNVSFISGTFLKIKFRRKFMLKYDIKNFLEQLMKNLLWKNITHEQTFSS